jgi:hypothetical protein
MVNAFWQEERKQGVRLEAESGCKRQDGDKLYSILNILFSQICLSSGTISRASSQHHSPGLKYNLRKPLFS